MSDAIPRPEQVKIDLNDRDKRHLIFPYDPEDRGRPDAPKSGKYLLRGAVCWPMSVSPMIGGGFYGFALLAGMHVSSGRIHIFEEQRFATVEHVYEPSGMIERQGVASFFGRVFDTYIEVRYFCHQGLDTVRKYRRQVKETRMVAEPGPQFKRREWPEDFDPIQAVHEAIETRRLFYRRDGDAFKALQTLQARPDALGPEILALACVLRGLRRYRKRDV
ncbi:MAG: hypothetical protein HN341_08410 [Verrucomicrobia bacterium]|jgi:hypothetical protein|nr:hypothetical protein [Verrucomicrobiota bacterium]